MYSHSLFKYSPLTILLSLVSAKPQAPLQQQAAGSATFVSGAAAANAAPSDAASGCGACALVADVAGLVWYSQVFVNAATEVVGVGFNNASRTTRTSIIQNEGALTYVPGGNGQPTGLTQINFATDTTIGGATLVSPTAYNVFTGYTITSAFLSDGQCKTTKIVSSLSEAFTQVLSQADGKVVLDANGQKAFIDQLGFTTCSGVGENYKATALLQVTNTTSTTTTTFSGLLAQQSLSISIPLTTAVATTSNFTFPSANAPMIVIGNNTITPNPTPLGLPIYKGSTSASASGYPGPTGSITPFLSKASITNLPLTWLAAWVGGLVGFGAGVYFM